MTLAGSRWMSNYYITPATGSSSHLERRCWNEIHVPAEVGPPGPWAPRSPVEQPRRTGKKRCYGHKSRQYVAVLFGLQLPLTHNPFNKVRRIYFSKELCPLVFIELNMYSVKCICVCIVDCDNTTSVSSAEIYTFR